MTTTSLAFLHATLDAAQAVAEAATKGPWEPEGDDPTDDTVYSICEDPDLVGDVVAYARGGDRQVPNMVHIGRHNPAAVLRRIAADRKNLARHCDNGSGTCVECGQGYECGDWGPDAPCATVRIIAEGWGWPEGGGPEAAPVESSGTRLDGQPVANCNLITK